MRKWFLISSILVGILACDDIIEVTDISKETVSVLAPTNGSVIDTTLVMFNWEATSEVENYHLQVATPTFENASQIIVDTLLTKTNYTNTLKVGSFEWRIRAENSNYETVYSTSRFIIED